MEVVEHVCCDPKCVEPGHIATYTPREYWKFGDVVRVDPARNPAVPQPDDRRWMIVQVAQTSATRQWMTLYLGPGLPGNLIPFSSLYGFVRVDE